MTCGADDPERANQGLTVAATAVAAGAEVSLWLAGEGVRVAVADAPPPWVLEHATSPDQLLAAVLAGGQVTVCSQCAARPDLREADLVAGARIAGAAAFTEEALREGVQALVY